MEPHLRPDARHLAFRTTESGDVRIECYDAAALAAVLAGSRPPPPPPSLPAVRAPLPARSAWSRDRAVEMQSDTDHVRRLVTGEATAATTATAAGGRTPAPPPRGSYWADLQAWRDRAAAAPTAWNLVHLAVALGGLGRAALPSAPTPSAAGFFELVDAASLAAAREKLAAAAGGAGDAAAAAATLAQQRATEAKILAAKCLSSRKADYPAVIDDFCRPAARADPQAAREAAFSHLSRGYEANVQQQHAHAAGEGAEWLGFWDEVTDPIVRYPCSTCASPCPSAPQVRLPWGLSVSVGELREKLDTLAPGFVDELARYVKPAECSSVKSSCS